MPYFFFDYFDGQRLDEDDLWVELPDLEAVYREAFDAAIEIWADALRERRNPSRDRFRIRDNSGNVVLELPLSELGTLAARAVAKLPLNPEEMPRSEPDAGAGPQPLPEEARSAKNNRTAQ